MPNLKNIAVLLVSALCVLYLVIVVAVFVWQRSLLYFPTRMDVAGRGNSTFSPFKTPDGKFWGYVREVPAAQHLLIFFHGNAGEAIDREWVSNVVSPTTVVLLAEYPGFGARSGTPTEKEIFADSELVLAEALRRWQVPVTLVGESLGTGVASYLASRHTVDRLALISPYSSVLDVAAYHYPFLPVRWLLKDQYRSIEFLSSVTTPLYIIHGGNDDVIPVQFGRRLFDSYPGREKTFTEIPKIGHNDLAPEIIMSPKAATFRAFLGK